MNYANLGRSGLKVSTLCLGAMMFGDQTTEAEATDIIQNACQSGVNFIDTADAYAAGRSEEIVGRAIQHNRDHWVLATKVGYPAGISNATGANLSRGYVMRAAESSLKRLNTDRIDLYYLHRDDLITPLEETVRALADLQRQGKICYFGVSNFRAWRLAELISLCDEAGIDRPAACQPQYNAMNRTPELELLPACQHFGVGVVPYSPLARGVLSGKYQGMENTPEGSRAARGDRRMMQTEWRSESLEAASRIAKYVQANGTTVSHFALKWVLNNALVHSVIAGPRTMQQWENYLAALDSPYSSADDTFADQLVAPGHSSTQGFTDPQYPVSGRVSRV